MTALPRLVTIKRANPDWRGHWHDDTISNISRFVKHAAGQTTIVELEFLCEKTLQPAEGARPYRIEMPAADLTEVLENATPLLGATLGVLHVVSQISRPFITAQLLVVYAEEVQPSSCW